MSGHLRCIRFVLIGIGVILVFLPGILVPVRESPVLILLTVFAGVGLLTFVVLGIEVPQK